MKSARYLFILAAVLTVVGCGAPALDCNLPEAKETMLRLVQGRLDKMPWYREMSASLTTAKLQDIRTEARDEKAGQAVCAATYAFDYNDKPRTIPVRFMLEKFEDSKDVRVSTDPNEVVAKLMATVMVERPNRRPSTPSASTPTTDAGKLQALTEAQLLACVDTKLAAYRKEAGADALASAPQLEEWEGQCKSGK